MAWWKRLLIAIVKILQAITFRCRSDCCSCESECLKDQETQTEEEVKDETETDQGTTWSAASQDQDIMDYVKKLD